VTELSTYSCRSAGFAWIHFFHAIKYAAVSTTRQRQERVWWWWERKELKTRPSTPPACSTPRLWQRTGQEAPWHADMTSVFQQSRPWTPRPSSAFFFLNSCVCCLRNINPSRRSQRAQLDSSYSKLDCSKHSSHSRDCPTGFLARQLHFAGSLDCCQSVHPAKRSWQPIGGAVFVLP
jgi:hypothetical protein